MAKKVKKVKVKKQKINLDLWKIATVCLAVLFIISIATGGFRRSGGVGADAAGQKTIDYLNTMLAATGSRANLISSETKGDFYNVKINIDGKLYDSYVSKDGKLLFPSSIDMSQPVQQQQEQQQQQQATYPKLDNPKVLMFIMSFCPYGQQAENALQPVSQLLGDKSPIEPHFVLYSNYRGGGPTYCFDEDNKYCSMHGIKELNENVRQLCIWKYQESRWWDYVMQINQKCSLDNIETCWEDVAEDIDVDTVKVKDCFENEALDLLAAEAALNAKYSVRGSPTILINEVQYSGNRAADAFKDAICSAYTTAPAECAQAVQTTGNTVAPTGSC